MNRMRIRQKIVSGSDLIELEPLVFSLVIMLKKGSIIIWQYEFKGIGTNMANNFRGFSAPDPYYGLPL